MTTALSPLVAPGNQFPQGAGNFHILDDRAERSTAGDRPFGLRFTQLRSSRREAAAALPPSVYCPDQQINLHLVTGEPWWRGLRGAGSMETTGPSTDGGPSTGGEEWKPDYTGDMP